MLSTAPLAPPQTSATGSLLRNQPSHPSESRRGWVECAHILSGLPCMNHHAHAGDGRGCVHHSTSGVPDRHDYGDDE